MGSYHFNRLALVRLVYREPTDCPTVISVTTGLTVPRIGNTFVPSPLFILLFVPMLAHWAIDYHSVYDLLNPIRAATFSPGSRHGPFFCLATTGHTLVGWW